MTPVEKVLSGLGPSRSSTVVAKLVRGGMNPAAARQAVARARSPVVRLALQLPHNERFVALESELSTERFFARLAQALDDTKSAYSWALNSLVARGGVVPEYLFGSKTGSPVAQKKHVPSVRIIDRLIQIGFIEPVALGQLGPCFQFTIKSGFPAILPNRAFAGLLAEDILLQGMKSWATQLGLISYHKAAIREQGSMPRVGTFEWDLSGPSYVHPLVSVGPFKPKAGFVVADVCLKGTLTLEQIQFALRKGAAFRANKGNRPLLQILVAHRFSSDALRAGRAGGLVLATPEMLLGEEIAKALLELVEALTNAADAITRDPNKVYALFDSLSKIEGTASQLRGPLFEFAMFHAIKTTEAGETKLGVTVRTSDGQKADVDVLNVQEGVRVLGIECKGKLGHLEVDRATAEDWVVRQVPRMYHHFSDYYPNTPQVYELWTTGIFSKDALQYLKERKAKTTRYALGWKDGVEVGKYVKRSGNDRLTQVLKDHFLGNPLSK